MSRARLDAAERWWGTGCETDSGTRGLLIGDDADTAQRIIDIVSAAARRLSDDLDDPGDLHGPVAAATGPVVARSAHRQALGPLGPDGKRDLTPPPPRAQPPPPDTG